MNKSPFEKYQIRDQQPIGDQLAEAAVNASYARSVPTAAGREAPLPTGRIFTGLLGLLNAGVNSPYSIPAEVRTRVHVRITMASLMGKSLEQPYVDSLVSFNKQAKKFRKRL
jgi:hypothetical protein